MRSPPWRAPLFSLSLDTARQESEYSEPRHRLRKRSEQKLHRGARIRTGDLADPNGARYQAAPRPDAHVSIPHHRPTSSPAPARRIVTEHRSPSSTACCEPEPLPGLLPQRPAGPRARRGHDLATGVSASAELFELAAARACRPADRPPRPVLGRRRRADRRAAQAPPASCCSTPTSRSPPTTCRSTRIRARQQRPDRARARRERLEPFAFHHGEPIGCLARLPGEGLHAERAVRAGHVLTEREPLVFDAGPAHVRTLAIVSGAGADYLADAAAAGADALLTGEPAERVMAQARESGLHFIAAGHYATETFGVQRASASTWPSASACGTCSSTFPTRCRTAPRAAPRLAGTPARALTRRRSESHASAPTLRSRVRQPARSRRRVSHGGHRRASQPHRRRSPT